MAQISKINYSSLNEYLGRIDAEFYKPASLLADNTIKNQHFKLLGNLVQDGYRVVYGNTKILRTDKVDFESDVRFLQATNISNDGLWIETKDIGFVSQSDWFRYPKGRIKHGEILIEVKGLAEKVTIVQDYLPIKTLVTGTLFKLTLKDNSISHEYLFAFFSSKYGKILRDRTKVNTLIAYVSKPELYKIPIPIFSKHDEINISKFIEKSFFLQNQSQLLYKQATDLLNKELGLDKIVFENKKNYTARFSEVVSNNRSDADYYQTKFRHLEKHIQSLQTVNLSSICSFVKGVEVGTPAYTSNGPTFIRVSNLTKEGFSLGNSDKYISNELYINLKSYQPQLGDILLTKDGTIGTCYVVDEYIEGIISSGIMNLNLFDSKIPKEYLALVINSKLCQMQAERECSGALITHWKPEQIYNLRIPVLRPEVMEQINELCIQSKTARKESKRLLEHAKLRVEELIEEAANKQ